MQKTIAQRSPKTGRWRWDHIPIFYFYLTKTSRVLSRQILGCGLVFKTFIFLSEKPTIWISALIWWKKIPNSPPQGQKYFWSNFCWVLKTGRWRWDHIPIFYFYLTKTSRVLSRQILGCGLVFKTSLLLSENIFLAKQVFWIVTKLEKNPKEIDEKVFVDKWNQKRKQNILVFELKITHTKKNNYFFVLFSVFQINNVLFGW